MTAFLVAAWLATAQQPQAGMAILAQAYDRCMVTQAVRLTRTAATDAEMLAQATEACRGLRTELSAAINAELPPTEAAAILRTIEAEAEPRFLALLARIRADRARRESGQPAPPR